MRALLYLYSNKNIVGSLLAIAAIVSYLTGLISDFWYAIAAGAYGIGALATPGDNGLTVELTRQMSDDEVVAGLRRLSAGAQRQLPAPIASDVTECCTLLQSAIPALSRPGIPTQIAYDVRTTATEYLPQTLDAYLRLPAAFRNLRRNASDGKTPTQLLAEQIGVLKGRLTEIAADLASADTAKLAVNGRFLQERFATPAFSELMSK